MYYMYKSYHLLAFGYHSLTKIIVNEKMPEENIRMGGRSIEKLFVPAWMFDQSNGEWFKLNGWLVHNADKYVLMQEFTEEEFFAESL